MEPDRISWTLPRDGKNIAYFTTSESFDFNTVSYACPSSSITSRVDFSWQNCSQASVPCSDGHQQSSEMCRQQFSTHPQPYQFHHQPFSLSSGLQSSDCLPSSQPCYQQPPSISYQQFCNSSVCQLCAHSSYQSSSQSSEQQSLQSSSCQTTSPHCYTQLSVLPSIGQQSSQFCDQLSPQLTSYQHSCYQQSPQTSSDQQSCDQLSPQLSSDQLSPHMSSDQQSCDQQSPQLSSDQHYCYQQSPQISIDQQSSNQQAAQLAIDQRSSQSCYQRSPHACSDGESNYSRPEPLDVSSLRRPHTRVKYSRSVVCSNTRVGDAQMSQDLPGVLRLIFQ